MNQEQRTVKIANFGGGLNSVAGLIKYGTSQYDEIVFADTGSEKPETYEYVNWLINVKGWPITIVDGRYQGKVLYDYYIARKSYPSAAFRDCTNKFKIKPMKKYLRTKYGKKVHFIVDLFIDYGEMFRMKTSDVIYQTLNYPLINDKIDRDGCLKIVKDAGFPIPMKSSCFMCPFNKPKQWLDLKEKHPDYGNSWQHCDDSKFWKNRLEDEVKEIWKSERPIEMKREIVDAINVLMMMYHNADGMYNRSRMEYVR